MGPQRDSINTQYLRFTSCLECVIGRGGINSEQYTQEPLCGVETHGHNDMNEPVTL